MKNKVKNIVILNDFDYIQGGASKVALQTANLLKESYPELNIYFFSGCHNDSSILNKDVISICTNQGEALKDRNKLRGVINGLYNFKAKKELKKLLKSLDKNETIIHVHGWTKSLSSSVFDIAFKMKFKIVLTMHDYFIACPNGGYFNYKKNEICHLKPMSAKCRRCNCDSRNYCFKLYRVLRQFIQNNIVKLNDKLEYVISISEFSEKILKQTLNPKTKIYRICNPVDFDKNLEKNDYNKKEYFLYVGRVSQEKGADLFCRVISELKLEGIVVGDGNMKKKLQKQYPKISFVGWKKEEDVIKYIRESKCLIFPSRLYETMGLTIIEALKCNIPCIVSSCSAGSEYVSNDYQFDVTNICSLKNKIIDFNNNKLGNFDFRYAKKFENEEYKIQLIEFYKKIFK